MAAGPLSLPAVRRAPAALAALAVAAAPPAAACDARGAEPVAGLVAEAPLVLSAPDGRRFRLAALAGEAEAVPEGAVRLRALGPADRHGRIPVLAFDARGSVESGLLRDGLARLTPSRLVPRDCWRAFERAETEAVRARRGLWAEPDAVIPATDAQALKERDGRFAVVEGRVHSVRTVGRLTYVNFGGPGTGALTVTIGERDKSLLRNNGLEPAAFRGHMLRVRGTVTVRRGPSIAAAIPEALTIAEPP